jgi:hypothetical protein
MSFPPGNDLDEACAGCIVYFTTETGSSPIRFEIRLLAQFRGECCGCPGRVAFTAAGEAVENPGGLRRYLPPHYLRWRKATRAAR